MTNERAGGRFATRKLRSQSESESRVNRFLPELRPVIGIRRSAEVRAGSHTIIRSAAGKCGDVSRHLWRFVGGCRLNGTQVSFHDYRRVRETETLTSIIPTYRISWLFGLSISMYHAGRKALTMWESNPSHQQQMSHTDTQITAIVASAVPCQTPHLPSSIVHGGGGAGGVQDGDRRT